MSCPKYVDSQRLCIKETKVLPGDTLEYCQTSRYVDCPFFIILEKPECVCEFARGCQVFQHLQVKDFREFVKVVREFCLSPGNINCARYKIKKSGQEVSSALCPDGRIIDGSEDLSKR